MRIFSLLALALATTLTAGCAAVDTSTPAPGRLELPLVADADDGTRFRLTAARLTIAGDAGEPLEIDASALSVVVQDLLPGDYTLALADGWRLQHLDGGTFVRVEEAVLLSPNPLSFTVEEGATTEVALRFGVGDGFIAFGYGRVRVSLDIETEPGAGNGDPTAPPPDRQSCFPYAPSCPPGEGCYPSGDRGICARPSAPVADGAICAYLNQCNPASACVLPDDGALRCAPLCDAGGDVGFFCDPGLTCVPLGDLGLTPSGSGACIDCAARPDLCP